MASSALRIASPATALALAGFVATGITSAISAPQPDTSTLAKAGTGRVAVQFSSTPRAAEGIGLFKKDFTQPAQQQVFVAREARNSVAEVANAPQVKAANSYYSQLRSRLRWVDVKFGGDRLRTPDEVSRIVLAQSAAQRAGLHEVGLNFRDVYGIIYSETSWIPRMGASKDGTPNLGIAQFEPATAKALGLQDPHDPVEAIHVAALHLKEAAVWSSRRIQGLKLSPAMQAAKLREGISIYYNLSSKGRSMWNGMNTAKLPIETRRHISNQKRGAQEAASIEAKLREFRLQERMTAQAGGARNGS
ncbi:MAG: hypothetical protein HY854_09530 [Burkholderiales bacterium]|nr:hypothetical protein [Burkholderiales bacterium]